MYLNLVNSKLRLSRDITKVFDTWLCIIVLSILMCSNYNSVVTVVAMSNVL
jgi:hypothetical protein